MNLKLKIWSGLLLLAALASPVCAQNMGYSPNELLVKFGNAGVSGSGARASVARQANFAVGARTVRDFPRIGWQHIKLRPGVSLATAVKRLKARKGVLAVSFNYRHKPLRVPNDPSYNTIENSYPYAAPYQNQPLPVAQYALPKVSAPLAWDTSVGSNSVVVAVIDTGVQYDHPDLSANMWRNPGEIAGNGIDDDNNGYVDDIYGVDTGMNDSDPAPNNDDHGTHCAGIIGATGNNSIGIAGACWQVKIMAIQATRANKLFYDSDLIAAFSYVVTMKAKGVNVRVTSDSYGGEGTTAAPLVDAINAAGNAGILSVFAAGNGGSDGVGDNNDTVPNEPSNATCASIVAVAASDKNDNPASFSNYGATTVDLAAPGVNIYSTVTGSTYGFKSGTSMATPLVAGAAALKCAQSSSISVADLKSALLRSVDVIPAWSGKVVSGGRLNMAALLSSQPYVVNLDTPADNSKVGTSPTLKATVGTVPSGNGVARVDFEAQRVSAANINRLAPLGISIPDNNTTGITDTVAVSASESISRAVVSVNISHARAADLQVILIYPNNNGVYLWDQGTSNGTASVLKINSDVTSFVNTLNTQGNWRLQIIDKVAGTVGTLNSWSLRFDGQYAAVGSDSSVDANNQFTSSWSPTVGRYNLRATAFTASNIPAGEDVNTSITVSSDPMVSVAVSPSSVAEDGANNLVYTFTRSGATTNALTCNFSVGGTATFGTDYTQSGAVSFGATSGTITFAAGSPTATVTLDPTADTILEGNETAILTVVGSTGIAAGSLDSATGTIINDETSSVLISEFRFSGPNGPLDEFIELFNATGGPINLSGYTLSAGTVTTGLSALNLSGKIIPAGGHLLLTNSDGYSLGTVASGDVTYTGDITPLSSLSLSDGTTTVDQVNISGALTTSSSSQYSYARRLDSGTPKDTGDDSADFNLLDTGSTQSTSGSSGMAPIPLSAPRLGAPGPQNISSPLQRNSGIRSARLVIPTGSGLTPEARYVSKGSTLDTKGRLSLRRTLTNTTGAPVTRLRFRIVSITGGTSTAGAGGSIADLRALSSAGVRYYDPNNGNAITQAAIGMTLDAPSSPTEAPLTSGSGTGGNGGGVGSSWTVTLPGGALSGTAPNNTLGVEFLFGIVNDGSYRVVVDAELLP